MAITPPCVETHAVTAPSVRDTLRENVASNCMAVNANVQPHSMAKAAAASETRMGRGAKGIMLIVANPAL